MNMLEAKVTLLVKLSSDQAWNYVCSYYEKFHKRKNLPIKLFNENRKTEIKKIKCSIYDGAHLIEQLKSINKFNEAPNYSISSIDKNIKAEQPYMLTIYPVSKTECKVEWSAVFEEKGVPDLGIIEIFIKEQERFRPIVLFVT